MKVTVITVTFKDLEGLMRTRQSVAEQSGEVEIEHVVVDGGTGAAVEEFLASQSGLRWVSEPDDGIYDAMNKGIAMGTGDMLWFMNSGDVFAAPDSVSTALRYFSDPRRQWGYGFSRFFDDEGRLVWLHGDAPFHEFSVLSGLTTVPHQAAVFGADLVARVGPYSRALPVSADQEFMLRCARVTPPIVIPEMLCDFDTTGVSTNRSIHAHFRDVRRILRVSGARLTPLRPADYLITYALEVYRIGRSMVGRAVKRQEGTRADNG